MFAAIAIILVFVLKVYVPRGIRRIKKQSFVLTVSCNPPQDELESLPTHIATVVWQLSAGEISFARARHLLGIAANTEMEARLYRLQKQVRGYHTFENGQFGRKNVWVRMVR